MKKTDLVNEVAKATLIKKEAAEAMEIFLGTIKKTLKRVIKFIYQVLELLVLSKEKQEQEEIQRRERLSK